jgi:uroporphyrinogen-III synthase
VRIVVTRPRGQAGELASRLERLGHEIVLCPLVEIEPLGDDPIDVTGFDWVVVTSPNGAAQLLRRASGSLPRVAAIGPGTAGVLADAGVQVDLVPAVSTQEGLVAEFPRPSGRVLFAGAEGARRILVEELDADFVPLYRTIPLEPREPPRGDLVVLASASAARAFAALGADIPVVSIGPETSRAATEGGLRVAAEAELHTLDGLVGAVQRVAAR